MKPIPLSFIAQYEYCPRSAYWLLTDAPRSRDENVFIQSGRQAHAKVDDGYSRTKGAITFNSSVKVFSEKFSIIGKIDVLEFHPNNEIIPIEFKRGKKRENLTHKIQLALAAICLKEMYPKSKIKRGGIFFTEDRHKMLFDFTDELLAEAKEIAENVTKKANSSLNPNDFKPCKDKRCQGCCFYDLCYI